MNLGETILRLRTGRGMSQEDLAAALEVSRQSVSKWETNASTPELDKLIKLSALFGVTLDELVTGEKKEPPLPESPRSMLAADPPRQEPAAISVVQKIAAGILLGTAAVMFLRLFVWTGSLLALLYSLPFLVCGIICLTMRRNAGLWCAWTVWACVYLNLQYTAGISSGMIFLTPVYTPEMNYIRLAFAWGEFLFIVALMVVTVVRFRKRPVEWNRKKRMWFIAGVIVLVLLHFLPSWLAPSLVPDHWTAYRILAVLLNLFQPALTTALLTALAQGGWKKPKP